jgi:hypothetical protein
MEVILPFHQLRLQVAAAELPRLVLVIRVLLAVLVEAVPVRVVEQ